MNEITAWIKRFFSALKIYIFATFLLATTQAFAKEPQKSMPPTLGTISFPTSANSQAESDFIKGVLLLHSFEYDRARSYFHLAEHNDPSFALAYWGEAMTYNQPLWNQQDISAARKVLTKLAPTNTGRVEKAKTDREKGFIKAINSLFGNGDKQTRDAAYTNAMSTLYQRYPNDDEIAAFYALALLGNTEGNRNFQFYMQAAAILEEILQHNPQHPGALHYAIHCYDEPIHAPLGLRAARIYSKIAPDASHALHMPSHIFLALGMWNDVINSNKAAWEAGVKNNHDNNPKDYTLNDFHALEWLVYAYLQKKQYEEAYQLVKEIQLIAEKSNQPIAKFHYVLMRADYLSESKDWGANLKSLDMKEMEPASRASNIYTDATIELHKGKYNSIKNYMTELDKISKTPPNNTNLPDHGDYYTLTTPTGILIAKIILLELEAEIEIQQGNPNKAISILKKAAQLEDSLRIGYGPPVPVKPAHEFLADSFLATQKYEEAYNEYLRELQAQPNRMLSNEGLAVALEKIKEKGLPMPKIIHPYFNSLMNEK